MKTLMINKNTDVLEVIITLPKGKLALSTGGVGPILDRTFTDNNVLEAAVKIQEEELEKEFKSQAEIIAFVKNKFGKESNYNSFLE